MSADFQITGHAGFTDPGPKVTAALVRTMRSWASQYLNDLKSTRLAGNPIHRRSGNLARDWTMTTGITPIGIVSTVATHGAADAYAGLQEHGGTIRPKRAKWLWIPTDENKTSAGVARVTPRQAIQQGGFISMRNRGGPFGGSRTFFGVPQTKGQAKGFGPHIVPLFTLVKQVTVKGNMGAGRLWEFSLPKLEASVAAALDGVI